MITAESWRDGVVDWTMVRILTTIKQFSYPLRRGAILSDISSRQADGPNYYSRGWAATPFNIRWRCTVAALAALIESGEVVEHAHAGERFYEVATVLDKLARV